MSKAFDFCIPTRGIKVPHTPDWLHEIKFDGCVCRKLNPGISVMQSAQDRATKNAPGAIDGARDRCIFLQG
jgi:hypothetical protein